MMGLNISTTCRGIMKVALIWLFAIVFIVVPGYVYFDGTPQTPLQWGGVVAIGVLYWIVEFLVPGPRNR